MGAGGGGGGKLQELLLQNLWKYVLMSKKTQEK